MAPGQSETAGRLSPSPSLSRSGPRLACERYSPPLGFSILNEIHDLSVSRKPEMGDDEDSGYAAASTTVARWASERVRDREIWGQSSPKHGRDAQHDIQLSHERSEAAGYPGMDRWASTRERTRELWGTDQSREAQDTHAEERLQGTQSGGQNCGNANPDPRGSRWSREKDRQREVLRPFSSSSTRP